MSSFPFIFPLKKPSIGNPLNDNDALSLPGFPSQPTPIQQTSFPKNPFHQQMPLNPFNNINSITKVPNTQLDEDILLNTAVPKLSEKHLSSTHDEHHLTDDATTNTENQENSENLQPTKKGPAPAPCFTPSAVPDSFIQRCQATLREVSKSSSLPSPSSPSSMPKNLSGKKTFFSSSTSYSPYQQKDAFDPTNNKADVNSPWANGNASEIWSVTSMCNGSENIKAELNAFSTPLKPLCDPKSASQFGQKTSVWKHRFPRGWYALLKKFLSDKFPDTNEFSRFQMYVLGDECDDWSELKVKCTPKQFKSLEQAMYEFTSLYSRSDLHILYQVKVNHNTATHSSSVKEPLLVAWKKWPHYVTQDLDSCALPFYSLVQTDYPASSSMSFPNLFSFHSPSNWPEQRIRSRQTADLFTQSSFDGLMHQFYMYLTYFEKAHPFSFRWKLTGSLGKHIVSSDHILPPNQPDTPFLLTSIQERYSRGTLRGSFAFNLWHDPAYVHTALLQKAGFKLQTTYHYLVMDIPSARIPKNYARVKFVTNGTPNTFKLKSVKTKDVVPVKFTLSFTDQVYDIRLRLVFKKIKEPIDLTEIQEKAAFLVQHGTERYRERFGASKLGLEEKLWIVQTQHYGHPQWPVKVKFSHWKSNKHPSYFTLQCNYVPSNIGEASSMDDKKTSELLKPQVQAFLEYLFKIASLFPKSV